MTTTHGGQVYGFAAEKQIAVTQIIDFSASINPISPQIDWLQLQQQAENELIHYPQEYAADSDSSLIPLLAERFKIRANAITLSNGISHAIWQFFANLPASEQQQTYLFTPIYSEYQTAAKQFSQAVIEIATPLEIWLQNEPKIAKNSVIVLVNPSTPQGKYIQPQTVQLLLKLAQQHQAWLLIDESFLPFVGLSSKLSARQWLDDYSKLVILQSLTKYYACPGVRIGSVFCNNPRIKRLLPQVWNLSTLDRLWLSQALQDREHITQTAGWLQKTKNGFIQRLQNIPCIKQVLPSDCNFVLVEFSCATKFVQNHLEHENILIRDVASFGFADNFARIAIRNAADNQQLLNCLHGFTQQDSAASC